MPRKQIDHEMEASLDRMKVAIQNPSFIEHLQRILSLARRHEIENIFDDRHDEEDSSGRTVYYGLYYYLRNVCDANGLFWQKDTLYVAPLLRALSENQDQITALETLIIPPECPPSEHWQWWRMAQTGFRLVREHEAQLVARHRPHGLTLEDIAEEIMKGAVVERTIARAIDKCWHFMEQTPVNYRRIADLAGLDDNEGLVLFMFSEAFAEQRKVRRAEHTGDQPDK